MTQISGRCNRLVEYSTLCWREITANWRTRPFACAENDCMRGVAFGSVVAALVWLTMRNERVE